MLIERKQYFDRLVALKDKQIIKIVTGVRRCGKSTLMEMFRTYLENQGVLSSNIIALNFEDFNLYDLRDPKKLYQYIEERINPNGMNYIFLDEIQHIQDFPRIVDSLFIKKNVDLYITGSNSYMLSGEIATLIAGRYIEISMLPLSFKEFVSSTGDNKELRRKYLDYIRNSSFPYTLQLRDIPSEIKPYLEALYNSIIVKDIAYRKDLINIQALEDVVRFTFDNIGNPLSMKKIADTLTSDGRKTDVRVVEKYLDGLTESFVLYKANRYNVKGKQYLKTLEKYYLVDIGLRFMLFGDKHVDDGHILENVVYLELIRRGKQVFVGKVDDKEVDFVAMDDKRTTYYQVAMTVRGEDVLKRELAPLKSIKDSYEKIILTADEDPVADYDGIKRINVLDWLIGDVE